MPEPTKHFNFIQVTLGVSPIETVAPAAGKPVGTIAFATDTEAFYEVCQTAANAHVWKPLAGPTAGAWSKYVVSNQATPAAPYGTVAAAIAAAVGDGHASAAPAVVLIMPGLYVEDVTLANGVSLQGLGGFATAVVIQGTVTASLDSGESATLRDLAIVGQFRFTSTKTQSITLLNVTVQAPVGIALFDDNSASGASLTAFNCQVITADAGNPAYSATTARSGRFRECSFASPTNGTAVALAGGNPFFSRCDFTGAITAATSGTATFTACRMQTTVNPCVTIGAGATVEVTHSYINSGSPKAFEGAGGFRASLNNYGSGAATGTGLTRADVLAPSQLGISFTNTNGTFPATSDVLLVDCSGGDVTITLPLVAEALPGRPMQVKSQTSDGIHRVILAAGAGQTIDGAATFNCALTRGWCLVAAQPGTTDWAILSSK